MSKATSLDQERGAELRMLRRMRMDLRWLKGRYKDTDAAVADGCEVATEKLTALIEHMQAQEPRVIRLGERDDA